MRPCQICTIQMLAMDSRSFDRLRTGSAGMTEWAATQGRPYVENHMVDAVKSFFCHGLP